jgi:hypothetical protein
MGYILGHASIYLVSEGVSQIVSFLFLHKEPFDSPITNILGIGGHSPPTKTPEYAFHSRIDA